MCECEFEWVVVEWMVKVEWRYGMVFFLWHLFVWIVDISFCGFGSVLWGSREIDKIDRCLFGESCGIFGG